jgi:hypothetical protein
MGLGHYVVNKSKKAFFDVYHKHGDLACDSDLWDQFITLMLTTWAGDEIAIMYEIDTDGYYDDYTRIKVEREEDEEKHE